MGGTIPKNQISKINVDEWQKVGKEGGIDIVRSNIGNGEGEMQVIPFDPRHEIDKELEIFSYRNRTDSPLVRCLGAELMDSTSKTMCGNQKNIKVITERIPTRFSKINPFTFPESLYVLSESLQGFEDLHQKAGEFEVTEKMIGVNLNDEVKVWLNENFGENHPSFEKPILQSTLTDGSIFTGETSEKKMVEQIVHLIESKTQPGNFMQSFKQGILKKNTFDDAISYTHNFIKESEIFVPSKLNQMKEQKSNTQGWESSHINPNNSNIHSVSPFTQINSQGYQESQRFPATANNTPSFMSYSELPNRPQQLYVQQPIYQTGIINRPLEQVQSIYVPPQPRQLEQVQSIYIPGYNQVTPAKTGVSFSYK